MDPGQGLSRLDSVTYLGLEGDADARVNIVLFAFPAGSESGGDDPDCAGITTSDVARIRGGDHLFV
jgi:hypothetical protein